MNQREIDSENFNGIPRFTTAEFHDEGCRGSFEISNWIGDNWLCDIYVGESKFVSGRWSLIDLQTQTAFFIPEDPEQRKLLESNQTYPYFDGYWGERAILTLDITRDWKASICDPLSDWHCSICWKGLGREDTLEAFHDQQTDWVCQRCYENYVQKRSLKFIGDFDGLPIIQRTGG